MSEPLHILIAEDEQLIADTLRQIFRLNGYDVDTAYNKQAALQLAKEHPPDVLLSNVFLGDGTGLDLAREVRRFYPQSKVLLISGQNDASELLADAAAHGENFQIVPKPVNPNRLLAIIKSLGEEQSTAA
jgi:two-component system, OmpR family, response regulator VicR